MTSPTSGFLNGTPPMDCTFTLLLVTTSIARSSKLRGLTALFTSSYWVTSPTDQVIGIKPKSPQDIWPSTSARVLAMFAISRVFTGMTSHKVFSLSRSNSLRLPYLLAQRDSAKMALTHTPHIIKACAVDMAAWHSFIRDFD